MKTKYMIHPVLLLSILLAGCSTFAASPSPVTASPPSETSLPTRAPTETSLPSSTPTETPLPTSTPLANRTATPVSPTLLEKQADGNWIFYDREAGFQFQLGGNWHLEDVSALDVLEIIDRASKITTQLGIKSPPQVLVEPQGMKVLGIYTDETIPDYMASGFNATYIVDEGFAKMSLEDMQKRVIAILGQAHGLDARAFDSTLSKNGSGTEYGVVIFNLALNYYQMRIFFKLEKGMGMITFGYSDQNADTFKADWALLTGSLQYTNP